MVSTVTLPGPLDYEDLATSQADDVELQVLRDGPTALQLVLHDIPNSTAKLWWDMSCGPAHPFIPQQHRRSVFLHYHSLNHPGILGIYRIINKRAVWLGMRRDSRDWTRTCLACQIAKIHRHTRAHLHSFPIPIQRFHIVHVDLVGPLTPSRGHHYLLTCVDRVTRWATAIPIPNLSTQQTPLILSEQWVADRYYKL